MNSELQKFFVGLMNVFSILLQGEMFTYLMMSEDRIRCLGAEVLQYTGLSSNRRLSRRLLVRISAFSQAALACFFSSVRWVKDIARVLLTSVGVFGVVVMLGAIHCLD